MNLIDKLIEARAWYAGLLDIAAQRTAGGGESDDALWVDTEA